MKITIITVGSPHLSFAKEGIKEYVKRIFRFTELEMIHVKEDKKTSEKILKLCEKICCVIR